MKYNVKAILIVCLLVALTLFAAGCSQTETPYQQNDAENYTVSVKYDANGGTFTTNTSVIVDSYNVTELKTNSEGKAQVALIAPESTARGKNAFTAVNNGYFLAGWYTERTENGTDANGNPAYTYGGKWDFAADRLTVDPGKTYTSSEPVLTLYAAWVPLFEVRFLDLATGEDLGSYAFNPVTTSQILLPQWDPETGAIEMHQFPEKADHTFAAAYYDAAGQHAVDTEALAHPGTVDETTGTAENAVLEVYVDWMAGEWYHIYNVEQFLDNASVKGSYVIHADLDFTGEIWPTSLMYGNFSGTIQGNGHTFSGIAIEQTNNSKTSAGLFGSLTEGACITELQLQDVTVTIKSGTRMAGTSYGLLAGTISDQATLTNVSIANSCLQIDSSAYFGTEDYVIGLVCGLGNPGIDSSGITCTAVGAAPESIVITVTDDTVTVAPAAT